MSLFSNDIRVANTAAPSLQSEPNVTQFGFTSYDTASANQLIKYVDLAQKSAEYAKEAATYVGLQMGEINEGLSLIRQAYADFIPKYEDYLGKLEHFNFMYEDMLVKYDKIIWYYNQIIDIYNATKTEAENAEASAVAAKTSEENALKSAGDAKDVYDDMMKQNFYRGHWDPMKNSYPNHQGTSSKWDCILPKGTEDYSFGRWQWNSGDVLTYDARTSKWEQIHSVNDVISVNGKSGAVMLKGTDILDNVSYHTSVARECNDLVKAGKYGCTNASTNWPFTSAGVLVVYPHNDNYLTQVAYDAASNKMRIRNFKVGVWTDWKKMFSDDELPTADQVKAVNLNYGVGAAGKDILDMDNPEIKGGMFNSAKSTVGAFADYMPFFQAARGGGADGTGLILQVQANRGNNKIAYRTRVNNSWTEWIAPYSDYNKPNAFDLKGMGRKEWDGDFNTVKEAGSYRFSSQYENGPQDEGGGNKPTYSNLLHVSGGGDTQWQMIGDFRGKELWWRGYNDSFANGGTWHRIYHAGRPPTYADIDLPYASRNKYDVRDYGVIGDGVTDDTDAFVRACNTVHGLNGTLTAPGNMRIKLNGQNRTVTVRCNVDFNNAVIDMSDFKGMIMFSRKVIDPITCWAAGKDPLNPGNPTHPLITALQSETVLSGGALKGWENTPEVRDSYFMLNTDEPLFSYRGGIKNRCEYNKIGRWGLLESMIKYPMDPQKISRILIWPMEKQMTVAQNIVFDLGTNDVQSPNVRIRTSNFTARNWRFIQTDYVNTKINPTVVSVERSANIVLEDIYFQWATHTTATTGFTYNIALNDNYNVSLKRVNGTGDGWGSTGSNNSRKVYFEQCNLSRIDFHEPMHEYLSLRDCHIGSWGVLSTAMGDINIEGGTLFRKANPRTVDRNGFIRSRTDSGFCDGNINIRNVTIMTDRPGVSNLFIHQNDAPDKDYIVPGSPVDFCYWKNITVDNVKFIGPDENSYLNLYPVTNCRDMALSGMRWPYALNITNCTGGNLAIEANLDEKILPYKDAQDPATGFIKSTPNHVINVTESNLRHFTINELNPTRKFVIGVNVDNMNPSEKATDAPLVTADFGGTLSLRNSTINSVDFDSPLSDLMVNVDGCKVLHNSTLKPSVVSGANGKVALAIYNSMISTDSSESLDTVKFDRQYNNLGYVNGIRQPL